MKYGIICLTDLSKDNRVTRQIEYLHKDHDVYEIGYKSSGIDVKESYIINTASVYYRMLCLPLIKLSRFNEYYWQCYGKSFDKINNNIPNNLDFIIANDITSLPFALRLKGKNTKIIFDAHECYVDSSVSIIWNMLYKKYIKYLCDSHIPKVDKVISVSPSLCRYYQNEYGIETVFIPTTSPFSNLHVEEPGEIIKIVHHGNAAKSRKLENMIYLMDVLDSRFILDLYLIPTDKRYYNKLCNLAKNRKNINIKQPIEFNKIVSECNSYDIGLIMFEPTTTNLKYVLPGKLFQYIQSRLAIVSYPSDDIAHIVRNYKLGIISDDFNIESLADQVNSITRKEIIDYKMNSHIYSKELSYESFFKGYINL